jgi:hypothetical protein
MDDKKQKGTAILTAKDFDVEIARESRKRSAERAFPLSLTHQRKRRQLTCL